jgi:hypothetical protein
MDRELIVGRKNVAELLRRMADGIEVGFVELSGRRVRCPEDLHAAIVVSGSKDSELEVLTVHVGDGSKMPSILGVERELTYPGA